MKKNIVIIISLLALAGCGTKPPVNEPVSTITAVTQVETTTAEDTTTEATTAETTAAETTTEKSETTTAQPAVSVDKNAFDVEITLSSEYAGATTQQELDQSSESGKFQAATLNSDGSVTYKLTSAQHKALLDNAKNTINRGLNDIIASGNYPNFTSITANDDFTVFTVSSKATNLSLDERIVAPALYAYGNMYGAWAGKTPDNIRVDFVDPSGNVIDSGNSSKAKK